MNESEERVPLEALDPASRDPGFWLRFHSRVMSSAQGELARRRMVGELGVVDVVFAWRRALVPLAMLAAALAGIATVTLEPEAPVRVVAVEEMLAEDLNFSPVSMVLSGEGGISEALFAAVEGGF